MALITYRFGEFAPDQGPYFSEGDGAVRIRHLNNMLPTPAGYKISDNAYIVSEPKSTSVQTTDAPGDRVRLYSYINSTTGLNEWLFAYYDTTASQFKVARISGNPPTTVANVERGGFYTSHMRFTKFGDTLIGTNGDDAIQRAAIGAVFAKNNDITGTPAAGDPRAKFVEKFKGHLFIGDFDLTAGTSGAETFGGAFGPLLAQRYRSSIWHSALNNERRFGEPNTTPAILGSDFRHFYDDLGAVTGLKACNDYLAVFRERGVVIITGPPFNPTILSENLGTIYSDSIVRSGSDIYFWSSSGPARIINGQSIELLGVGKINDWVSEIWDGPSVLSTTGASTIDGRYIVWSIKNRSIYSPDMSSFAAAYNYLLVYSVYTDNFSLIKEHVGSLTPLCSYHLKYGNKSRFAGISFIGNGLNTIDGSGVATDIDFFGLFEYEYFNPDDYDKYYTSTDNVYTNDPLAYNNLPFPFIQTEYMHFPSDSVTQSFRIQRVRPIIYVEGLRGALLNDAVAVNQMRELRIYPRNRYEGRDISGGNDFTSSNQYISFTTQDADGWFLTDGCPQSNLHSLEFIFNKDFDSRIIYGFEMEVDLQSAYGTTGRELTTI